MYYIVDTYFYYIYDTQECAVSVLAMAKTKTEICKLAKQIKDDPDFERYFGYCHCVGIYKSDELVSPYRFKKMHINMSFDEALKQIKN